MELESYVDSGGHAPDKPPMSRPFSRVEEATDHNMHGARFWLVSAAYVAIDGQYSNTQQMNVLADY